MAFEKEDRIREATIEEVRRFFQEASERDWDGMVPPFIDWGRLRGCDGFFVAEHQGAIIATIATASQGMDGSTLPTIANVYVARGFCRKGVGTRLLAYATQRLLALGTSRIFCKAVTRAMVRTIHKLPVEIGQHIEFTSDLGGNWLTGRSLREETRGLD